MSQLIISRLLKPSVCRNFLRRVNVRQISYTSGSNSDDNETKVVSRPAYPFMLIDHLLNTPDSPDCRVKKYYHANNLDGSKEKEITILDDKLVEEVCNAMTVGFSRDGLLIEPCGYNKFTISYKPSDPKLKDMTVYLPPLYRRMSEIQSLAMSSLPNRDKDWVVVAKLSESRLSICRPFGSAKWIDIKTTPWCIDPLSSLMFSKRYRTFYIPSRGGNYFCYLDDSDELKFSELHFDDLPNSVLQELVALSSYTRTDHFVESPTRDFFLVKWYSKDYDMYKDDDSTTLMPVTRKFMVFREGIQSSKYEKTMIYTEDIGDLCIFLGHSEAYCVPASSSPGLRPNCIYFVGRNFGVYDLTTKTCTTFNTKDVKPLRKTKFPYWPAQVTL